MPNRALLVEAQEPHIDCWHYLISRDERHKRNYIEWKYFNFTQDNLAGYIIYYVMDPEMKAKTGGARLLVRVLKDGVSYGEVKRIRMDEVEFDSLTASMRMGKAEIRNKNSYEYEINSLYEGLSFHLDYRQKAPTVEPFLNLNTCPVRWEKISWLVKMPKAKVTGELNIGGQNFKINAWGYSDTNWGEMVPYFTRYEWGQYNDDKFSLAWGALYGFSKLKSSYFYFFLNERLVMLEDAVFEAEHLEWAADSALGVKVPSKSRFRVKGKEYEIEFSTKLLYYDSPGMNVHPLLPKTVISEQIVSYEGRVMKNGEVIYSFQGKGFQEYPLKTWKKLPLPFD